MELFLADLTAAHGSVHAYAADRLGVDDALLTALQRRLLTEDRREDRSDGGTGN
jgi:protein-tyrosine phosphatase